MKTNLGKDFTMDQAQLYHLRQQDRDSLEILLRVINGAMNSVRRDDCGDWTIAGSRGTIRACGGKFFVYIPSGSALAWTWAKKKLASFATVHQDGDEEGILIFSKMPDADEAEMLRSYIGLRQTRDVSPDQIQKARDAVQNDRPELPMR